MHHIYYHMYTAGASTSNSDMPLREDILVTVIICSVIGAILLMLLAVLVILLVIVYWNKGQVIMFFSLWSDSYASLSHNNYTIAMDEL